MKIILHKVGMRERRNLRICKAGPLLVIERVGSRLAGVEVILLQKLQTQKSFLEANVQLIKEDNFGDVGRNVWCCLNIEL